MKIREITAGLQFPEGPIAMSDGSVILVEIARGTLSRVTPDGRIRVLADLGGGPNGAAVGPDGAVYVCNNGGFNFHTEETDGCFRPVSQADGYSGGRIERVNLANGKFERVYDSVDGIALRGPNDIVFDAHGGFYFTDLGKTRAHDMDRGGVFYGRADGAPARSVARPVMTPNGVGLSPDGKTLYYAETEGARIWAFDITAPGQVRKAPWPSPHGGRMVAASPGGHYQRFDSMALEARGHLCVATLIHGGITVIAPDGSAREPSGRSQGEPRSAQHGGRDCEHVALQDRYTTNICFGGRGMRTAYVTLSGSGRLIAIDDWPQAGLVLQHPA